MVARITQQPVDRGPRTTPVPVFDRGREPYEACLAAMRTRHAEIAGTPDNPGEVWLVEHEPVFTAGRATSPEDLEAAGAVPIERGGRITFHGPGQLVVYPLVRLAHRDLRRWLRGLETFGVAVCAAFGLDAEPSVDGTGVFVAGSKVASIGVAVRRWVNLHGIALNLDMDLGPFHRVRPCGLDPEVMADLARLADSPPPDLRGRAVDAVVGALPALLQTA